MAYNNKKKKEVTFAGTIIKNDGPKEHEFCVMERISEAAFNVSNAHFMIGDLLEEKVFDKKECFLKSEISEIERLQEMHEELLAMYDEIQEILKRFIKFHEFKAESDFCKCYEEKEDMDHIYYQCPECRFLEEEGVW